MQRHQFATHAGWWWQCASALVCLQLRREIRRAQKIWLSASGQICGYLQVYSTLLCQLRSMWRILILNSAGMLISEPANLVSSFLFLLVATGKFSLAACRIAALQEWWCLYLVLSKEGIPVSWNSIHCSSCPLHFLCSLPYQSDKPVIGKQHCLTVL